MPAFPPTFDLEIEKLVFGGEGLGYFVDPEHPLRKPRPVFVAGALPGEAVRVRPLQVRSKFAKAKVLEVLRPSELRVEPREPSYQSTSPWQILDIQDQLRLKQKLTQDMWHHSTGDLPCEPTPILPSTTTWGYRNKVEYSVTGEPGALQLAFRERGQYYRRVACPDGTALLPESANAVAREVIAKLNEQSMPASAVKNLLIRHSFATGQTLAALFVMDENIQSFELASEHVSGWHLVYSDPERSANVLTKEIFSTGSWELHEDIAGIHLAYGHESFFQVNPPAFTALVDSVKTQLRTGGILADLYCGVGTIGLALASEFDELRAVELHPEAARYAEANLQAAGVTGQVVSGATESQNLTELCAGAQTVVVDPPRAGLHSKAVQMLLDAAPEQLVYISCNPATQARDWAQLRTSYTATSWQLVDLYPHTPHVESVLVMKKQ